MFLAWVGDLIPFRSQPAILKGKDRKMLDGKIIANLRDKFFENNPNITNPDTLGKRTPGVYLKNRIEKAFIAGCNAIEELKTKTE